MPATKKITASSTCRTQSNRFIIGFRPAALAQGAQGKRRVDPASLRSLSSSSPDHRQTSRSFRSYDRTIDPFAPQDFAVGSLHRVKKHPTWPEIDLADQHRKTLRAPPI